MSELGKGEVREVGKAAALVPRSGGALLAPESSVEAVEGQFGELAGRHSVRPTYGVPRSLDIGTMETELRDRLSS
jgi:hypothetical protein